MLLVLLKVLLAPLIVLVASLLADRLGPQRGGFFIGLPTTSLPFMLVVWLASGTDAAIHGAVGGMTGQITCALFCVAYARTAVRLGSLTSMLAAAGIAVVAGFTTLTLHVPLLLTALATLAAVVGLATWPPQGDLPPTAKGRRFDIPVRMVVAGLTVVVMSGIEPYVGATLAGALASLPMISMVMTPAIHAAQGPGHAVAMTRGTLGSIPGTSAFLCVAVLMTPHLGLPLATLGGLVVLPFVNMAVARLGAAGAARRRRRLVVDVSPRPRWEA